LRVLKWVLLGIVTPVLVIGVPTLIAKKVLEQRRQSQAAQPLPAKDAQPDSQAGKAGGAQ
jgi:hypothetical protein